MTPQNYDSAPHAPHKIYFCKKTGLDFSVIPTFCCSRPTHENIEYFLIWEKFKKNKIKPTQNGDISKHKGPVFLYKYQPFDKHHLLLNIYFYYWNSGFCMFTLTGGETCNLKKKVRQLAIHCIQKKFDSCIVKQGNNGPFLDLFAVLEIGG